MKNTIEGFGELVFGLPVMEARLSAPTFASLKKTIETGSGLDARCWVRNTCAGTHQPVCAQWR